MPMSPASFMPPPRRHASAWLYAMLLSLIFNVGFVYLFRPKSPSAQPAALTYNEPACILIDASLPKTELEASVVAYAQLANPTAIAQPDPEIDMATGWTYQNERVFHDLPDHSFNTAPLQIASLSGRYFDEPLLPFKQFSAESLKKWTASAPPSKPIPQQTLPKKIIWRYPNGKPIQPTPELTTRETETLDAILAQSTLNAPTTMNTHRLNSGLPRVTLEQSSGNHELDLLALRAIARWASQQPGGTLNNDTLVEVEWRLKTAPEKP